MDTSTLIIVGGIVTAFTPVLMQVIKKRIPKDWRTLVPVILGLLTGIGIVASQGINPFSVEGMQAIFGMIGAGATGQSIRDAASRGPVKKLRDKMPD
jgi:hypothetical protein